MSSIEPGHFQPPPRTRPVGRSPAAQPARHWQQSFLLPLGMPPPWCLHHMPAIARSAPPVQRPYDVLTIEYSPRPQVGGVLGHVAVHILARGPDFTVSVTARQTRAGIGLSALPKTVSMPRFIRGEIIQALRAAHPGLFPNAPATPAWHGNHARAPVRLVARHAQWTGPGLAVAYQPLHGKVPTILGTIGVRLLPAGPDFVITARAKPGGVGLGRLPVHIRRISRQRPIKGEILTALRQREPGLFVTLPNPGASFAE